MNRGRRFGLLPLVALLACAPAPRPSDADLYARVTEAVGEAVAAPVPIRVHPRLMQRPQDGQVLDQGTFNAFDSTTIAGAAANRAGLTLCELTPVGSCEVPEGGVAVVLSEMQELGANGVEVAALVMDGREGRTPRNYATVRVKPGTGGWQAVAVKWR
jgi:hypothetical protein